MDNYFDVKLHKIESVNLIAHISSLLLLMFISAPGNSQSEWKLEKSGKGITVYTRQIPETSIKEFKAEITIKANIGDLEDALRHVEDHHEWMTSVESVAVLKDQPEILQYNMHLPFPFTDRYVVLESNIISKNGTCRVNLEYSEFPPGEIDDRVKIEFLKGYWLFTMIDNNTTSVIYQFVSDPGGSLPDWLVNSFIVKNPYATLGNLRKRLE
jgi:uncharacterized membrane protein